MKDILKNLNEIYKRLEEHQIYLKKHNDDFVCEDCLYTIDILESKLADLEFIIACLEVEIEKKERN